MVLFSGHHYEAASVFRRAVSAAVIYPLNVSCREQCACTGEQYTAQIWQQIAADCNRVACSACYYIAPHMSISVHRGLQRPEYQRCRVQVQHMQLKRGEAFREREGRREEEGEKAE